MISDDAMVKIQWIIHDFENGRIKRDLALDRIIEVHDEWELDR